MTKIEKLEKFIKNNKLEFVEGRRNNDITILSGFACYIDATEEELKKAIKIPSLDEEIERVFDYAKENDYGEWWTEDAAKIEYKF